MPVYEYKCKTCGKVKEVFFSKISDRKDYVYCDDCDSLAARIMSTGSFVLKGGGWANDGYSKCKSGS